MHVRRSTDHDQVGAPQQFGIGPTDRDHGHVAECREPRTDRIGDQVRVAEHRLVDDHHLHQTLPSASYRMVAAETSGEEGSNDPTAARGNSWPSVTKAPGAVGTLASS